jgi:hypothetical protein
MQQQAEVVALGDVLHDFARPQLPLDPGIAQIVPGFGRNLPLSAISGKPNRRRILSTGIGSRRRPAERCGPAMHSFPQ